MATLQSPLPLPRSLQELILAKLPLQDLLRSQAVCKLWRRISSTRSFRKRYEWLATKPWFLLMQFRKFIVSADSSGKPLPFPPSDLYADSRAVSTSAGLLLLKHKTGHFAVVNPITMDVKHLPALDVTTANIVYSGILCSDAASYKVVTMGLMEADKLTGHLYSVRASPAFANWKPWKDMDAYMQPFMRVYSSSSEEWTSITDFPPGFLLPFRARSESHKSFISKGILYCTINTDNSLIPGRIARFDMETLQWKSKLVDLPEKLLLCSFMEDEGGELVVVMARRENASCIAASIDKDKVVIRSEERLFPKELHPTIMSFQMLQVWGLFGKVLCLHVPLEANGVDSVANWDGTVQRFDGANMDEEPKVYSFLFDVEKSVVFEFRRDFMVPLPMGIVLAEMVHYVKLVFHPSLRVP